MASSQSRKRLVSAVFGCALLGLCAATGTASAKPPPKKPRSVWDFTVNTIDGKPRKLSTYKGKVLLIVNTASQ